MNPPNPTPVPDEPDAVVEVSRFFDAQADAWEAPYEHSAGYPGRFFRVRMERVLAHLGPVADRAVLDIGCASGSYVKALTARGARLVGFDLAPAMVARAAARARHEAWPGLNGFCVADCTRLPFRNRSLDAAICIGVIEYVPEPDRFLARLASILRPGGRLVLTAPNPSSVPVRMELGIHGLASRLKGRPAGDYFHERPTPDRLVRHLSDAGFIPGRRSYCSHLPYNLALRLPGSVTLDRLLGRVIPSGASALGATAILTADLPA